MKKDYFLIFLLFLLKFLLFYLLYALHLPSSSSSTHGKLLKGKCECSLLSLDLWVLELAGTGVSVILLPVTHDHEIKCFFFHMLEGPFSTLPV